MSGRNFRNPARRGAALVEFAAVSPVLMIFVLGMIEVGRAIMVSQVLTQEAREGARLAVLETSTTASVQSAVGQKLTACGISGATVDVLVNGKSGEIKGSTTSTPVTISITVPYSNVSWLPNSIYLVGKNLSGTCSMRHE